MLPDIQKEKLSKITTIIFDVDDTLYDVGTGFTAFRNSDGVTSFMVSKLNFPTKEEAQKVRDEYFARYHATAKGLMVAEDEGKLPIPLGWEIGKKRFFDPQDLSNWWAENLDFSLLGGPYHELAEMLKSCPLTLIAFSNGPRKYVLRVLRELGLQEVFPETQVFAVDDVLPYCKPEKKAFEKMFAAVGITDPSECIMVEDSMKNIRISKDLGMTTVLVTGCDRRKKGKDDECLKNYDVSSSHSLADAAEATKPGDAPNENDPSVDICIESVIELQSKLHQIWDLSS